MPVHRLKRNARPRARAAVSGLILAGMHDWWQATVPAIRPRALAPVLSVPLVVYAIRWLIRAGVEQIVICANYTPGLFRNLLKNGSEYGAELFYYEDRFPRGPAGCLFDAATLVPAERYVVLEASSIPQADGRAMLAEHVEEKASGTIAVRVENGGADGKLEPIGVYVFEASALESVPHRGYEDIKEGLISKLSEETRRVRCYRTRHTAPRVTGVSSYLALNEWALLESVRAGVVDAHGWTEAAAESETVHIDPDARVVGPCFLADGTTIASGAAVIGPTVIGRRCTVGPGCVVTRSVLWDDTELEPGAVVRNAVCAPWGECNEL